MQTHRLMNDQGSVKFSIHMLTTIELKKEMMFILQKKEKSIKIIKYHTSNYCVNSSFL